MSRKRRRQAVAEKKQPPAVKPMRTGIGPKNIVAIALLLFVAASVAYLFLSQASAQIENPAERDEVPTPVPTPFVPATLMPSAAPSAEAGEARPKIIAYYFHGEYRCPTCTVIEQYAQEALETGLPEALQSGALEWRSINAEEPEHQHFIADYQLYAQSLILAVMVGDTQVRWKNLDQVWTLVRDKSAFISYVQEETRAYLEEN